MANIDQVQLPDGSQYRIIDDTSGYATTTYVQDQISTINKNTIGLGNVDNTADINKPVSLPQQDALNGKIDDDIVAYVESDTTATKRYEVGDQFILNGVLYTATAIIAVNDTIVIGTNCDSAESVATQITENANAIVSLRSDITSINQTGTTATQAISSGTYFYLNGTFVSAKTDIASGATFTLNTNYEIVTAGGLNDLKSRFKSWKTRSVGAASTSGNVRTYAVDLSDADFVMIPLNIKGYSNAGNFLLAVGSRQILYWKDDTGYQWGFEINSTSTSVVVKTLTNSYQPSTYYGQLSGSSIYVYA